MNSHKYLYRFPLYLTCFLVLMLYPGNSISANTQVSGRDSIFVIGHAHMDMNWLWPYTESTKMMHDNIRQVVAFMEQFPDFTMLQSQATIYKHIAQIDPPLFEKVKKYVKEGRFEPVGGMWTEGDCNLSGGEALVRSFLLGQRFFYNHFGKIAHVGWLPDNFGHISQFPQILKLSGCDYFYFHRCKPYTGTFWWKGSDSSAVLCYANNTYNGNITSSMKDDIDKLVPEKRRLLQVTGVGDHGGGPTLANIEMVHKLNATPGYPSVTFSTAERFFRNSLRDMKGRPTHNGEMQFIFEGCYTSVAEIKENTRKSENSLYRTELLTGVRWLYGDPYPAQQLNDLWETVTFNQFHDILPGSAIYETYQDAVADHKMVQKKSNELFDNAFRRMADEVNVSKGKGQPVIAFNFQPRQKKMLVQAEVFTYTQPAEATLPYWNDYYAYNNIVPANGKTATVYVCDQDGKTYPAQITGGKVFPPGFRSQIEFVTDDIPAGGYKTFYIDAMKPGVDLQPIQEHNGVFETEFFVVGFDTITGDITTLKDKRSGTDYVSPGGRLNRLMIYMEEPNSMNAWTIGNINKVEEMNQVKSFKITEGGPVRACVEVVKQWGRSTFTQRTYIYKMYPRIDFDLEADWFEIGDGIHPAPFLRAVFDLSLKDPHFINHVPFDAVERPVNGQEVPAQQWVDVTDERKGIALLNTTKFGHSFEHGQLRLSLLRATYNPNKYPNIGVNHIHYALFPHTGDWKNGVWSEGEDFNIPVYAAEPPSLALTRTHATRPQEDSLLIVSPRQVVLSGFKEGIDGHSLIVRLVEVEGKETVATVTLPAIILSASRVNLIEFPLKGVPDPKVNGRTVTVTLKPHEIATIALKCKPQ